MTTGNNALQSAKEKNIIQHIRNMNLAPTQYNSEATQQKQTNETTQKFMQHCRTRVRARARVPNFFAIATAVKLRPKKQNVALITVS